MGRRATVPRLSVVLAVEGAPQYAIRAVESVQNQNIHDIQIVISYAGLSAGVLHSLESVADRDIHVDLVDAGEASTMACVRAGVDAARGTRVAIMRADDWYGPAALSKMLDRAIRADADIAFPQVLRDRYDSRHERHSRSVALGNCTFANRDELAQGIGRIVSTNMISCARGPLIVRDLLVSSLDPAPSLDGVSLMAGMLSQASSAMSFEDAVFHMPADTIAGSFDPSMFLRACEDLSTLKSLLKAFDGRAGADASLACERRFYGYLVAAIENLCLSPRSVSSIERNARLRDMLQADSTRAAVAALAPLRRELGPMWKPISSARPFSCVVCAHLSDFLNLSVNKTA